jgi:hypothetical protein
MLRTKTEDKEQGTESKRQFTGGMPRTVKISMVAVLSATAIGASYGRPVALNVEPMSLIVFLSGLALGVKLGAVTGIISMTVYSTYNPLGPAPIPIFLAQIGCTAMFGAVGGLLGRSHDGEESRIVSSLKMGAVGLYLTLVYDLVTNLGFAVSFYGGDYGRALITGSYFMVIHVLSNTLFFGIAGPVASHYVLDTIRRGTA